VAISGRHCQFVQSNDKTYKPIASVAALSVRLGQLQILQRKFGAAEPPDLSFRGAKRRGNLLQPVTFSPMPACGPARSCEIATAPLGPRNDKLGGVCGRRECLETCNCPWRSLSAATDAIGACHFNGSRYELQVPSRDCHVGLRPPRNDKLGGPLPS